MVIILKAGFDPADDPKANIGERLLKENLPCRNITTITARDVDDEAVKAVLSAKLAFVVITEKLVDNLSLLALTLVARGRLENALRSGETFCLVPVIMETVLDYPLRGIVSLDLREEDAREGYLTRIPEIYEKAARGELPSQEDDWF